MRSKKYMQLLCLFTVSVSIFFSACRKAETKTFTLMIPVYKEKSAVLASINGNASQPIETTGKIYVKDHFIYLNEIDKGIHIIDNTDPSHPVQTAFLDIPGNQDIAIRGNILYADMYGDLLAIDISNPKKVIVTKDLSNFFRSRVYINNVIPDDTKVVVEWIKKDTTILVNDNRQTFGNCANCDFFAGAFTSSASSTNASGVAGSFAKMILLDDYLYAITDPHMLGVVNVSAAEKPAFTTEMSAGYDLETIYPFDHKLFIGSSSGLFMYDLADPANPTALGQFAHGRACDPVVADGNYAYVTLHAGTNCGGEANELNVINVKNLLAPQLVRSYPMTKPTGLCKDGNLLFVCDSTVVKLFNATDANDLKLIKTIPSDRPYDIIAGNNHALIVAKDGLYQYDYSDPVNIRQLSFFSLHP